MRGLKFRGFVDEVEVMAKVTKKTRGKGKPIDERIEAGADRILLDIVTHGQVVRDINGKLVQQTPSAAMLAVICKRVRDLRNQRPYSLPAESLIAEAARRGLAVDGPVGKIGTT